MTVRMRRTITGRGASAGANVSDCDRDSTGGNIHHDDNDAGCWLNGGLMLIAKQ